MATQAATRAPGRAPTPAPARARTQPRALVRIWMFNGVTLQDPFPGRPLEAVRRVHATQYSAITNAKIDGPEYRGHEEVYTYRIEAGVNG